KRVCPKTVFGGEQPTVVSKIAIEQLLGRGKLVCHYPLVEIAALGEPVTDKSGHMGDNRFQHDQVRRRPTGAATCARLLDIRKSVERTVAVQLVELPGDKGSRFPEQAVAGSPD